MILGGFYIQKRKSPATQKGLGISFINKMKKKFSLREQEKELAKLRRKNKYYAKKNKKLDLKIKKLKERLLK